MGLPHLPYLFADAPLARLIGGFVIGWTDELLSVELRRASSPANRWAPPPRRNWGARQ